MEGKYKTWIKPLDVITGKEGSRGKADGLSNHSSQCLLVLPLHLFLVQLPVPPIRWWWCSLVVLPTIRPGHSLLTHGVHVSVDPRTIRAICPALLIFSIRLDDLLETQPVLCDLLVKLRAKFVTCGIVMNELPGLQIKRVTNRGPR